MGSNRPLVTWRRGGGTAISVFSRGVGSKHCYLNYADNCAVCNSDVTHPSPMSRCDVCLSILSHRCIRMKRMMSQSLTTLPNTTRITRIRNRPPLNLQHRLPQQEMAIPPATHRLQRKPRRHPHPRHRLITTAPLGADLLLLLLAIVI